MLRADALPSVHLVRHAHRTGPIRRTLRRVALWLLQSHDARGYGAATCSDTTVQHARSTRQVFREIAARARVEVDVERHLICSLFGSGRIPECPLSADRRALPSRRSASPLNDRTDMGRPRRPSLPDLSGLECRRRWREDVGGLRAQCRAPEQHEQCGLMSVEYNRPRLFINLIGGWREGQGVDAILFPNTRPAWGPSSCRSSRSPGSSSRVTAIARCSTASPHANPYYFENRIGGKINIQLGPRILLRGYGLTGPNNYPRAAAGRDRRRGRVPRAGTSRRCTAEGFRSWSWRPIVRARARATQHSYDLQHPDRRSPFLHSLHGFPGFSGSIRAMNSRTVASCSVALAFGPRGGRAPRQEPARSGDYAVGPRDLLEIKVLELPELNVDRRVSDNGTLDLPLLGAIPSAGMTASEIRDRARGARSRRNTSTAPTSRSSSRSSRTSRSRSSAPSSSRARWRSRDAGR